MSLAPAFDEVMELMFGLHRAVAVLMQTTVDTFIGEYTLTIERQTARLQGFNRLVGHELRQPLSALTSAVAVLRQSVDAIDTSRLQAVVDVVERNVDRLTDLTGKLAALSRLRGEEDNAQIQRVELRAVAGDVVRQLKDMAEARGVDIRVSDALPEVTVDVGSIELILVNLMSNAIKYSDPHASSRVVEIAQADAEDGYVAMTVRDNGIGIDSAHLPSVFDRFYRAHAPRDGDPAIDGLGLGLAIVHDCVQAIGGRISVSSTPTEGTTFTITIPTSPVSLATVQATLRPAAIRTLTPAREGIIPGAYGPTEPHEPRRLPPGRRRAHVERPPAPPANGHRRHRDRHRRHAARADVGARRRLERPRRVHAGRTQWPGLYGVGAACEDSRRRVPDEDRRAAVGPRRSGGRLRSGERHGLARQRRRPEGAADD